MFYYNVSFRVRRVKPISYNHKTTTKHKLSQEYLQPPNSRIECAENISGE